MKRRVNSEALAFALLVLTACSETVGPDGFEDSLTLDVTQSNTRGRVSFARSGANSRTTHVFVNHKDNSSLDDRFAPFGEVVEGMDVVDGLYAGYGDGPPRGDGVYQARALALGAEYFDVEFPELDRIERATIL